MRASIGRLKGYAATSLPHDPWPQLEYYGHACLLRLQWKGHGWDGRPFAFAEAEYDTHMAEIERIERSRRGVNATAAIEGPSPSVV